MASEAISEHLICKIFWVEHTPRPSYHVHKSLAPPISNVFRRCCNLHIPQWLETVWIPDPSGCVRAWWKTSWWSVLSAGMLTSVSMKDMEFVWSCPHLNQTILRVYLPCANLWLETYCENLVELESLISDLDLCWLLETSMLTYNWPAGPPGGVRGQGIPKQQGVHLKLASFPGLPRFSSLVCVQYNTRKRKSAKNASVYYTERKPKT